MNSEESEIEIDRKIRDYLLERKSNYNLKSDNDFRLILRAVFPEMVECSSKTSRSYWTTLNDVMCKGNKAAIIFELQGKITVDEMHFDLEFEVFNAPSIRDYEISYDKNELHDLTHLGEREYLFLRNKCRFIYIINKKYKIQSQLDKLEKKSPQYYSYYKYLKTLECWEGFYSDWFLENNFDIPNVHDTKVDSVEKEKEELERELKDRKNEDIVKTDMILKLKKRDRSRKYFDDVNELKNLIDATRKKNQKHNYSALGRELCCNNETAKKLVKDSGLLDY